MKVTKYLCCFVFILISQGVFGQKTYNDTWFAKHCQYCQSGDSEAKEILLSDNNWHNAHINFTKKDFSEAKKYLLNDTQTNDTLKTLLEKHILLKLEVDDNSKSYFLNSSYSENKDIKQFATKSLARLYFKKKKIRFCNYIL